MSQTILSLILRISALLLIEGSANSLLAQVPPDEVPIYRRPITEILASKALRDSAHSFVPKNTSQRIWKLNFFAAYLKQLIEGCKVVELKLDELIQQKKEILAKKKELSQTLMNEIRQLETSETKLLKQIQEVNEAIYKFNNNQPIP